MIVTLILCPSWDTLYPLASFGLLSAQLKAAGHDVRVLDLNKSFQLLEAAAGGDRPSSAPTPGDPWSDEAFVREQVWPGQRAWIEGRLRASLSEGCRLFGFSVYPSNEAFTREVARSIKRLEPSATVAFGGPGCLTMNECLAHLREASVDAVFYGEADRSFPRFVADLARTGSPRGGPGTLLRADPTTWNEGADRVEDLDELPFADFEPFGSLAAYRGKTLHTTRGCVRRCVFCADWREMPYRTMKGRRVFEEVVHQLGRHPETRNFIFGDSVLNASLPDLAEFCDRATGADLRLSWWGYAIARPDLGPGLLERMKGAGCESLMYGIESGSERVLKAMDKPVPTRVNARVLADTTAAGIKAIATWIVGFPTETDEAFEESLSFLRENARSLSLVSLSLFSIAELRAHAARYGLDPGDSDLFWSTHDGRNTFPVRLKRLRRTLEVAAESGIAASYQGKIGLAELPAYEERVLEMYRRERPAR